jgi:hypothetical protein
MKKKKWAVGYDKTIGWVIDFIKRYLKLEASQALVRHDVLYLYSGLMKSLILFAVSLFEPVICAVTRSVDCQSLRVLWI